MSEYDVAPSAYRGTADGVPGVTRCPDCGDTLRSTTTPDPDDVSTLIARECQGCDYSTHIGVLWFPDHRYVVVSDLLAELECTTDGCSADAPVATIPSSTGVVESHCLDHTHGHLASVAADFRLL